VITDSIMPTPVVTAAKNIRVLPLGSLLADAITRTANEESLSALFY
jgi:ribose-phosphate pyrophosphokinase